MPTDVAHQLKSAAAAVAAAVAAVTAVASYGGL